MCLPPTTYEATERELHAFYAAVTGALPVMAYNNPEAQPARTCPPELIADLPGIVAVKECSGDARRIAQLIELSTTSRSSSGATTGRSRATRRARSAGSPASPTSCPAECLELERLVQAGDLAAARALWPKLAPLRRLDMDPRLVQSFKAALDLTGHYGGPIRPPRLPLDDDDMERVRAAL